jgi:uncharacterized membrane protein
MPDRQPPCDALFCAYVCVAGLSWIIAIVALPYLSETIPIHWNSYGEADGFAQRAHRAFSFSALITLTAVFLTVRQNSTAGGINLMMTAKSPLS